MKKNILRAFLLCIFLLYFVGCASGVRQEENRISVSILPIKYWIDEISGGDFEVTVVVPSGASPETYEPTPTQMKEVSRSYGYIQIGLIDFEQPLVRGIKENNPELSILTLSDGMELLEGVCGHVHASGSHHHHGTDPHVWLSPVRSRQMVAAITEFLTGARPDSAMKYLNNQKTLLLRIDSLDRSIREAFNALHNRTVLIYHPFLTYYCDDYNLTQLPVEQEGKEPSVSQLKKLVSYVKEEALEMIFYQDQLHFQTVEALIHETGIRAVSVDPLAYDWLENLYFITAQIARHNADEQ